MVHVEEGCTQPDQNAYKHSIAPSSTGEAELLDIYNCHSLLKKRAKHLTNKAASLAEARDETMSRIMQIEELASTFDNFTIKVVTMKQKTPATSFKVAKYSSKKIAKKNFEKF